VALAAKESLENLIGSFTIFLDKPFAIGDVIQVGAQTGTIETIGFRSTRLRAEDRSYITIPNRKMVENEVVNITRRNARRVRMVLALTYQASSEQLRNFIADTTELLNSHEGLVKEDNRVSLLELTPTALEIQVLFYIATVEQDIFLRKREEINFAIIGLVRKHELSFATPGTTVVVDRRML
jgi:MscS family membrane protein